MAGLGLGVGLSSGSEGLRGLGLGPRVELGFWRGEGVEEPGLEEKKEVIWNCLFTSGDRPLLWRRDDAMKRESLS